MNRPMRVLLFSTLYPSAARPNHGLFVEARFRRLTESGSVQGRVIAPVPWFPSRDARFGEYARFAATPPREARSQLQVAHPRYLLPPKIGMLPAPLLLALGARSSVEDALNEGFDFDLIDAHYYYPDGVAAAILARWFRRPYLITARGSDLNLIANHALPRRMMQWAAARATGNVAVSSALGDILRGWNLDPERVHVVRNGVDNECFRPESRTEAQERLGLSPGTWLLSVGNLVELKRHHLAIDALAFLRSEFPDARLAIVGQGLLADRLGDHARSLGLGDVVHFAGARPQDELRWWYSAAEVMLLASEREGLPNVVLEALSCGTPVVASNVGGIPEVLTEPALGRLVEPSDVAGYGSAAASVLAAPPPREVLRAHALSMDWSSTTDRLIGLFRAAVPETLRSDGRSITG